MTIKFLYFSKFNIQYDMLQSTWSSSGSTQYTKNGFFLGGGKGGVVNIKLYKKEIRSHFLLRVG